MVKRSGFLLCSLIVAASSSIQSVGAASEDPFRRAYRILGFPVKTDKTDNKVTTPTSTPATTATTVTNVNSSQTEDDEDDASMSDTVHSGAIDIDLPINDTDGSSTFTPAPSTPITNPTIIVIPDDVSSADIYIPGNVHAVPISNGSTSSSNDRDSSSSASYTNSANSKGGFGSDDSWNMFTIPEDVDHDVWGNAIGPFGQCGGIKYAGNDTCIEQWVCVDLGEAYSQCLPQYSIQTNSSTSGSLSNPIIIDVVVPTFNDTNFSISSSDSSFGDDDAGSVGDSRASVSGKSGSDIRSSIRSSSSSKSASYSSSRSISDSTAKNGQTSSTSSATSTSESTSSSTAGRSYLRIQSSASSKSSDANADDDHNTSLASPTQFAQVPAWLQCGGTGLDYLQYVSEYPTEDSQVKLECVYGYQCDVINTWFYQCVPVHDLYYVPLWYQCGGGYHQGATQCIPGATCKYFNPWYSQCVPE